VAGRMPVGDGLAEWRVCGTESRGTATDDRAARLDSEHASDYYSPNIRSSLVDTRLGNLGGTPKVPSRDTAAMWPRNERGN